VIRPIRSEDRERLSLAYDHLSPESQYRRFLAPKPHLSKSEVHYLSDVDGCDHYALIATPVDHPEWILAVGRFVRLAEDPRTAEFAIVVGDPFQGEGLGTEIMERLVDAAVARGISRFTATMLADNEAAHRLLRRLAGRLTPQERHLGLVNEIELELPSGAVPSSPRAVDAHSPCRPEGRAQPLQRARRRAVSA
jgi:RimJ/RimL family protein N-acetyltransferase